MPIYEYSCKKCNAQFELLLRGEEQPECPGCGGHRLEKLLSVPAAHMAGSNSLPTCPAAGSCGIPSCGPGGCGMECMGR